LEHGGYKYAGYGYGCGYRWGRLGNWRFAEEGRNGGSCDRDRDCSNLGEGDIFVSNLLCHSSLYSVGADFEIMFILSIMLDSASSLNTHGIHLGNANTTVVHGLCLVNVINEEANGGLAKIGSSDRKERLEVHSGQRRPQWSAKALGPRWLDRTSRIVSESIIQ
jgi:hypothetical protein